MACVMSRGFRRREWWAGGAARSIIPPYRVFSAGGLSPPQACPGDYDVGKGSTVVTTGNVLGRNFGHLDFLDIM